jgi:GGDEF domain-containing protein
LSPAIESVADAENLALRILENVHRPFQAGTEILTPSFSAGIAIYPQDGTTPEELMAGSDRALYAAKRLGKNRYAFADSAETDLPAAEQPRLSA